MFQRYELLRQMASQIFEAENPFLKQLKEQNIPDEQLQEWMEKVNKDDETKWRHPQRKDPELTFLVLGLAGMGKSTLLNSLLKREKFSTGSTEQSSGVTKKISSAQVTYDGVPIEVIDTPGFGDLTISPRQWCIQLYYHVYRKKINMVLFVLRADSHRTNRWNLILAQLLPEFISDDPETNPENNIALVFTHMDKLNQKERNEFEEKCDRIKEQFNKTINKSWKIRQIFYFDQDHTEYVDIIYQSAFEARKEKELILRLPNLTLIKNIFKEELGYDHEEEYNNKSLKEDEDKGKDEEKEVFGDEDEIEIEIENESKYPIKHKKRHRSRNLYSLKESSGCMPVRWWPF